VHFHPDFATISLQDRAVSSHKVIAAVAKAEQLRARLLQQYTDENKQYYIAKLTAGKHMESNNHNGEPP